MHAKTMALFFAEPSCPLRGGVLDAVVGVAAALIRERVWFCVRGYTGWKTRMRISYGYSADCTTEQSSRRTSAALNIIQKR